jgi:hypothetical protein
MPLRFHKKRILCSSFRKRNGQLRCPPPVASLPTLSVFPLRSKLRGKKATSIPEESLSLAGGARSLKAKF